MRWVILVILCADIGLGAPGDKGKSRFPRQNSTCNDVPAHPFDLILGRPTRDSVTLSILTYQDTEGQVVYGTQPARYFWQTPVRPFKKGEPMELAISSLQPNTGYHYEFRCRGANSIAGTFHTQRAAGSAFTFTVTADSHLDENTDPKVYQKTLANALADKPDFHIDLGDTFMTEKHENREAAFKQYLAQRFYFGQLCHSAPLFLVLGNHDGESPRGRGSDADGLAIWSNLTRKRYFPNPVPDNFYTGNANKHTEAGLLQDYYAWEWGDALFVVLDPFWFTQRQRDRSDNWKRTLGDKQYQWLKQTLETSRAKFKFVFIHHLVGGADEYARGGAEAAAYFEWGGKNPDGKDAFKEKRPGWPMPIHQLLVRNRVNIVFHGHDHFYAKQDLDGIVYQLVPQPGHPKGSSRNAAGYGYKSGTILDGSGHLRVALAHNKAQVDYVRVDKSVAHTYTIPTQSHP